MHTQSGLSLSFKVDSLDGKAGGLAIEYCRKFQAFSLSLYPIFTTLKVVCLAGCQYLVRVLCNVGC